jgi:hypothetical protein
LIRRVDVAEEAEKVEVREEVVVVVAVRAGHRSGDEIKLVVQRDERNTLELLLVIVPFARTWRQLFPSVLIA